MTEIARVASRNVPIAGTSPARAESRWRLVARNVFPFLVLALAWECAAHLGIFPRRLFPPLEEVARTLVRLTAAGILPHHVLDTLMRLAAGVVLAAIGASPSASP